MYRYIVVLRAVTWFLLAGFCLESLTLALPLVVPDYSRNSSPWNRNTRHSLDNSVVARVPQILTASDLGTRDIAFHRQKYEDAYQKMSDCYQDLLSSSLDLSRLSSDVVGFEDVLVEDLKLYQNNLLCIRTNLDYLGRGKGLEYYDRNSDLETLIKEVINVHKNTLSYIDAFVFQIDGIGPVIGPVLYDIKCVLDKLLDAAENFSDVLINVLRPLIAGSSLDTLKSACKSGLSLLGICL